MKHYFKVLLIAAMTCIMLTGCTSQSMAKNWGGTSTLDLPANQKLVEATWKDNDLWYLTKPMTDTDIAENYTFQESSSWGILEGTVVIVEHKYNE